jgi:hypothetical protein
MEQLLLVDNPLDFHKILAKYIDQTDEKNPG